MKKDDILADFFKKSRFSGTELTVTSFNTLKGKDFNEVSVDKFLKRIEKNINKHCEYIYDTSVDCNVYYKARVIKYEDDYYGVSFLGKYGVRHYSFDNGYNDYYFCASNNPYLKKRLDEFANITERQDYEKKCFDKVEENVYTTTNENKAYLNYVEGLSKYCTSYILKMCGLISGLPIAMSLTVISGVMDIIPLFIMSFVLSAVFMVCDCNYLLEGKYNSLFGRIRTKRLLKKKILQIKEKIARVHGKNSINENKTVVVNKDDIYKDTLINYMNSIMNATNRLNDDDKKIILNELRELLMEYENRCRELDNNNSKGLTLSSGKRKVTMDILDKLTSLSMKTADLLNKDNANKNLYSDCEKFKQSIDDNLKDIEEGKKLTLARGK